MSESVSWNPNTNCRRKLFIYVVPHIIVTKAKVLNFKVGEGTIADGKKVWTSVLVDAVEGVTGAEFKGQQYRPTLKAKKCTLKCPSHGVWITAGVETSAIKRGVDIKFELDRPKELCPCGEWKLIKFLYWD